MKKKSLNSTMVRLKREILEVEKYGIDLSQFHYGSIKTKYLQLTAG